MRLAILLVGDRFRLLSLPMPCQSKRDFSYQKLAFETCCVEPQDQQDPHKSEIVKADGWVKVQSSWLCVCLNSARFFPALSGMGHAWVFCPAAFDGRKPDWMRGGKFWSTLQHTPSGKLTKNYRKSPFWMGKSTIHGVFSTAMLVYQKVGFTGGLQGHGLGFLWRWHLRPGPAGRPSPKMSKDVQRILKDTSPSSLPPVFAFGCLFVGVGMWHVCGCARFLAVSISLWVCSGRCVCWEKLRKPLESLSDFSWRRTDTQTHAPDNMRWEWNPKNQTTSTENIWKHHKTKTDQAKHQQIHLHFKRVLSGPLYTVRCNSNDGTGEPRTSIKLMCAHASTCCRMLIHICKERMHAFVCVSARNPVLTTWSYIRYCFTYIHMYTYACVCVCVCVLYIYIYMSYAVCVYIYMCVFIYLFMYVCMYLFIYLFIY